MKRLITPFIFLLISACGDMLDYNAVPDYADISALITPTGRTVMGLNHYISVPTGGVGENFYLEPPEYTSVRNHQADQGVPVFIMNSEDKFIQYLELITFPQEGYEFLKEVRIGFRGMGLPSHSVYELQPGADPTRVESWVDRTSEVEFVSDPEGNSYATLPTRTLSRYLLTTSPWFDQFYLDDKWTSVWPSNGIKPRLVDGRYRATVIDEISSSEELFGIQLYFVKLPVEKSYNVVDMTATGQLSNTNDGATEIVGYFDCSGDPYGTVSCNDVYVSKSGTLKYSFVTLEGGFVLHYVLFRNVVVRQRSTGKERTFNGYYELRN